MNDAAPERVSIPLTAAVCDLHCDGHLAELQRKCPHRAEIYENLTRIGTAGVATW
jgi:hypothetical protein